MKLIAKVNGETSELMLNRSADKVSASIDGREYELEVVTNGSGHYSLRSPDGKKVEARVSTDKDGSLTLWIDGRPIDVDITDPKQMRAASVADADSMGSAAIKTAMPGKIVRLLASVGDEVQKGDGVIVVEAMKMQNEIKAPKNGTVSSIAVAEGDTVNAGQILLSID
jgi:biotin carboxyl carrier protein